MASASFLNDCQPPWAAFPDIDPDELPRYLKQGVTEVWFDQIWRPFWQSLSQTERVEYLRHWGANERWRDAIREAFDPPDFDLAADAAGSEREIAEARGRKGSRRSLWSRLFGRR